MNVERIVHKAKEKQPPPFSSQSYNPESALPQNTKLANTCKRNSNIINIVAFSPLLLSLQMPSKNSLEYTLSIALNNVSMAWDDSVKIPRIDTSDRFVKSSVNVSRLVDVTLCLNKKMPNLW